jgi:hypothetical protein
MGSQWAGYCRLLKQTLSKIEARQGGADERVREGSSPLRGRVAVAIAAALVVLLTAVAVATGAMGELDLPGGGNEASTRSDDAPAVLTTAAPTAREATPGAASGSSAEDPAPQPPARLRNETLPCTGPQAPVNFETFSAGPAPAGLPLTATYRRCDLGDPSRAWLNNYVNYSYGTCDIPEGSTGCMPPLTIQTWPACQRPKDEYSFEGKPLPQRQLPKHGGAEVVEFLFPTSRIEVYTKAATIVIFADDQDLARKAVRMLRPRAKGKPPATDPAALAVPAPDALPAPADGSTTGFLPC